VATDAIVVLQSLQCISLSDTNGRAPYIWPVLLWIDDNTLQTPDLVGVFEGLCSVVITNDMHVGDTVDIPYPVSTLAARFEDHLSVRRLILVVALWEKHDTPDPALFAGCGAFSSELRAAIAENLFGLNDNDDSHRQQILSDIKRRVHDRVYSAISHGLTTQQKIAVFLGTLHLDDARGSDFNFFPDATPTSFSLTLADDSSNTYAIQGALQVRPVKVDPCQAQVDRVNAAQNRVNGLNDQKTSLQTQLDHAGGGQKAGILAEMKQVDDELVVAQADLNDAIQALQACRDRWKEIIETIGAATAGVGEAR
jgi:hypothetical protein